MSRGASTIRARAAATRWGAVAGLLAAAAGAAVAAVVAADAELAPGPSPAQRVESAGRGAAPAPVRWGKAGRRLVRCEDVVRNEGAAPLRDVECVALLPLDEDRQALRWFRLSDHDWVIRTDSHGQRVATAKVAEIAPGDAVCFSWIASVDVAEEDHRPRTAGGGSDAPALPDDVLRYLGDGPRLDVESDEVRAAAAEVRSRAGSTDPLAVVRAATAYVRERIAYRRAGGWDSASVALRRGDGSCSESTFAFAAICRRLGVPVRWTGGTMLRRGVAGRAVDSTFHRIAEAWIPGHGWLPVETTAEEPEAGETDGWRIPAAMLQLAKGDGSGDAGAGVSYFLRDRWTRPSREDAGPGGRGATSREAVWLPGVDDDLARRGTLHGLDADALPSFSRAELLACDARGFGPPLDASGAPLRDAAPPVRPTRAEAAALLLAAGHPEGVRLALEAATGAGGARDARVEERLRACCDEALRDELLPLLRGTRAAAEAWWDRNGRRVLPEDRGRLVLADAR